MDFPYVAMRDRDAVDEPAEHDESEHMTRQEVLLMVSDALHRNTTAYYVTEDGTAQTVTGNDATALWLATRMRGRLFHKFEARLSSFLIIFTFFEDPFVASSSGQEVWKWMIRIVEYVTVGIFWIIFALNLRTIWGKRNKWHLASEPWWVLGLGVALVINLTALVFYASDYHADTKVVDGVLRTSSYHYIAQMMRAYFFIHFNKVLRYALYAQFKVLQGLGPVLFMVSCSFMFSYFLYQFVEDIDEPHHEHSIGKVPHLHLIMDTALTRFSLSPVS